MSHETQALSKKQTFCHFVSSIRLLYKRLKFGNRIIKSGLPFKDDVKTNAKARDKVAKLARPSRPCSASGRHQNKSERYEIVNQNCVKRLLQKVTNHFFREALEYLDDLLWTSGLLCVSYL